MFTGIITDVGRVRRVEAGGDTRIEIETAYDVSSIDIGASIACSGVCLTVVERSENAFSVDVSGESLSRSVIGEWQAGSPINLERALAVGDELGGHIVSGHVDGVGKIVDTRPDGDSVRISFEAPEDLERFIAEKGSITVDGISLTVNEVSRRTFGVNVIPHTLEATTLGTKGVGDRVHLEIDMLARYVARLMDVERAKGKDGP